MRANTVIYAYELILNENAKRAVIIMFLRIISIDKYKLLELMGRHTE